MGTKEGLATTMVAAESALPIAVEVEPIIAGVTVSGVVWMTAVERGLVPAYKTATAAAAVAIVYWNMMSRITRFLLLPAVLLRMNPVAPVVPWMVKAVAAELEAMNTLPR